MAEFDSQKKETSIAGKSRMQPAHPSLAFDAPTSDAIQRTQVDPTRLRPAEVLMLQRTIGNQAVQRLLDPQREPTQASKPSPSNSIQRKVNVGAANDRFEQEADKVAHSVVSAAQHSPGARVQPQVPIQRNTVQRDMEGSFMASSDFEQRLQRTKGGGQALSNKTRAKFEPLFGADFSRVRIHTNPASNALNREIQAKAFTHGNDIHFREGAYNPDSTQGSQLLAHELTHTIQQTGGQQTGGIQQQSPGLGTPHGQDLTPAASTTIQRAIRYPGDESQTLRLSFGSKELWSGPLHHTNAGSSGGPSMQDVPTVDSDEVAPRLPQTASPDFAPSLGNEVAKGPSLTAREAPHMDLAPSKWGTRPPGGAPALSGPTVYSNEATSQSNAPGPSAPRLPSSDFVPVEERLYRLE